MCASSLFPARDRFELAAEVTCRAQDTGAPIFEASLNQQHPLQAGMPVLAGDDVVMHGNPERARDVDDCLEGPIFIARQFRSVSTDTPPR
jgi:hypothetical protein